MLWGAVAVGASSGTEEGGVVAVVVVVAAAAVAGVCAGLKLEAGERLWGVGWGLAS